MKHFLALVLSLVCTVACGQIKLIETVSESNEKWTGFVNAVVNEDGSITAAPGSKPELAAPSIKVSKYSFVTAVPYKFGLLKVKRIPTGEQIRMDKEQDKEVYSFRSGAVAGEYEFSYTVFDSERGLDNEVWTVKYNPIGPRPNPGPIVNPDGGLTGLPEEARLVLLSYVQQMATDMRTAAKEIKAGSLKTNQQVQQRGQALDMVSRTKFKQSIGALMNKYSTDPPTADMFDGIATGYEAVK